MNPNKIRIATIGTSWITAEFIEACRLSEKFDVVAVFSRSLEQARKFAEENGIEKTYTDMNEMLSATDLDAIYIASPNDMHFPQSVMALKAGKHVISEKPMVSNSREFVELTNVIKTSGKYCFEAITTRHLPNLEFVKEGLKKIGVLKLVRCDMTQYSSRYNLLKEGKLTNVFDPNHSGGALYDLGIYTLALNVTLFGEPQNITYQCNQHENGVDLSGIMTMRYPGFLISNTFTKDSYGKNQTYFEGDGGYVLVDSQPSRISVVEVNTPQGKELLGVEQNENRMVYESIEFARIINEKDDAAWKILHRQSEILAGIMEEARKQAGIVFAADSR